MKSKEFCPICNAELLNESITNIETGELVMQLKCTNCECYLVNQDSITVNGVVYFNSQTNELRSAIIKNQKLYQELVSKLNEAEFKMDSVEDFLEQREQRDNAGERFWQEMQKEQIQALKKLKKDE